MYQVDPSGAAFAWKATAIGKNYINAKNFLERRYHDDMELDDAIHIALLTLRESYEGEMNEHNIEVGIVSETDKVFRILRPLTMYSPFAFRVWVKCDFLKPVIPVAPSLRNSKI